jgi:hypothetical protein
MPLTRSDAAFDMTTAERDSYARDGFLVRTGVFSRAECAKIAGDCEALVDSLMARQRAAKVTVGSYMFELQRELTMIVKWEPDAPDLIQGVEPFAHLSEPLKAWGLDPRVIDPCKTISGAQDLVLFTEKLNLKRAHKGGPIVLHQDFPYWEEYPQAAQISTAMIYLDDATRENGCLEVAPGSHTVGKHPQRKDTDPFGGNEMDVDRFDLGRLTPVEAPAGSVIYFGAFLAHRSLPNASDADRRALLYSFQPAAYPHMRESLIPGDHRSEAPAEGVT